MNGPIAIRTQLHRRAHTTCVRDTPRVTSSMIKETQPLGPTGHLLHKATLPKLGVIADLPNTQKQTQRGSKNGETDRPQMKEQENSPKEELNEMEASNLSNSEFKILIIRMPNTMKKGLETIKRE